MEQNGREKKRRSKVVVESEKVRFEEEDGRKRKTVWKRSRSRLEKEGRRTALDGGRSGGLDWKEREWNKRLGGSGARGRKKARVGERDRARIVNHGARERKARSSGKETEKLRRLR